MLILNKFQINRKNKVAMMSKESSICEAYQSGLSIINHCVDKYKYRKRYVIFTGIYINEIR